MDIEEVTELTNEVLDNLKNRQNFVIKYKNSDIVLTTSESKMSRITAKKEMKNGKFKEYFNIGSDREKLIISAFEFVDKHSFVNLPDTKYKETSNISTNNNQSIIVNKEPTDISKTIPSPIKEKAQDITISALEKRIDKLEGKVAFLWLIVVIIPIGYGIIRLLKYFETMYGYKLQEYGGIFGLAITILLIVIPLGILLIKLIQYIIKSIKKEDQ